MDKGCAGTDEFPGYRADYLMVFNGWGAIQQLNITVIRPYSQDNKKSLKLSSFKVCFRRLLGKAPRFKRFQGKCVMKV